MFGGDSLHTLFDLHPAGWQLPEPVDKRLGHQRRIFVGEHATRADTLARYEAAYAERPRPNGALFENWFLEEGVMW